MCGPSYRLPGGGAQSHVLKPAHRIHHVSREQRQAVVVTNRPEPTGQLCTQLDLKDLQHLSVAVLLHDVDAIMVGHEFSHGMGGGKCPQAQIVRLQPILRENRPSLDHGVM